VIEVLNNLKDSETVAWAVDKFLKVGLIGFIVLSVALIAKATMGFTFDVSVGLGL